MGWQPASKEGKTAKELDHRESLAEQEQTTIHEFINSRLRANKTRKAQFFLKTATKRKPTTTDGRKQSQTKTTTISNGLCVKPLNAGAVFSYQCCGGEGSNDCSLHILSSGSAENCLGSKNPNIWLARGCRDPQNLLFAAKCKNCQFSL